MNRIYLTRGRLRLSLLLLCLTCFSQTLSAKALKNASVSITFAEQVAAGADTQVYFAFKDGVLSDTAKTFDKQHNALLSGAMALDGFKGEQGEILEVLAPHIRPAGRVLLVGLGDAPGLSQNILQHAGSELVAHLLEKQTRMVSIVADRKMAIDAIAFGALLNSYRFNKYRSEHSDERVKLSFVTEDVAVKTRQFKALSTLADSVFFARDLVNEPGSVVYPQSAVERLLNRKNDALKVKVLDVEQMKALGMNAIVGVGQGSVRPAKLVIMQYQGGSENERPIALTGKGITFDSGGISLKSGDMVWLMKGDLAGAAAVMGTMLAIAENKLPVNVVGVVALVENMPDALAQRPGDVVKTLSGKTIEVINTDAEGRLTLADVLWFTQTEFNPRYLISLATMTGAKGQALGKEYAALFSNSDSLTASLIKAGNGSSEKLWRMPVSKGYDQDIESDIADMRNIGSGMAGATAAAKLLEQFMFDRQWAYIDMAENEYYFDDVVMNPKGASGFGVKLLYRFLSDAAQTSSH